MNVLLICEGPRADIEHAARVHGVPYRVVAVNGTDCTLLAPLRFYDEILAWWLAGDGLRRTTRSDSVEFIERKPKPLAAVGPSPNGSALHGVALNGRVAK